MSRYTVEGHCHICGVFGPLTFEHVPPAAAFNKRPVVAYGFREALDGGPDPVGPGQIRQRGAGDYTLCGRCNNSTGRWYTPSFASWCYQGMGILSRARGAPSLIYLHYLFPLAIIKQIVTMFFSINSGGLRRAQPQLVRFVLNPEQRFLDPRVRLYAYYTQSSRMRAIPISAAVEIGKNTTIMTELSFPPFGYVMTFDSPPPDRRLFEITHFAQYRYKEFTVATLRLPVLPTEIFIPGDYRTRERIYADRDANLEKMRHVNQ